MANKIRVWDLPTRVFHWALAACVVGLVITGNVGGNAMVWHFRLGYAVLSLLLFRIVWGFAGGYWSRFSSFLYSPRKIMLYLQGKGDAKDNVGHNPLGALSVIGLLVLLAGQAGTGLFSDDEIAFAGPLTRFVTGDTVSLLTWYHKNVGKTVILVLVALHVIAILFYLYKHKENLVRPMVSGDKEVDVRVPASKDSAATRFCALVVLAVSAGLVSWLVTLGV